jgi:cytochrome b561
MPNENPGYGRVAIALHWLIGLALIGQIVFGLLLDQLAPRNTPARAMFVNLHKSTGIVLGVLILARIAWRLWHRPPAWPASMPGWQASAARLGHAALYVCMVVMPLSGYIASNFSKYGVKLFGHALAPWGPESPPVYAAFNTVHVVTAWIFCVLIVGHVLAAAKHAWIDHDSVFRRMWPFIIEEKSS